MPDFYRLIIDSNVIDSREAADISTSTIVGAILGFGNRDTGMFAEHSREQTRFPFRVRVVETDKAALIDKIQDVLDVLALVTTKGFTVENEDGDVVVDLDVDAVELLDVETKVSYADYGAIIEGALVADLVDPTFTDSQTTWQYQRNSSGRAFCIGRVRAATRALAVAAVAPLRSGAVRPTWMHASLVVIEDTNDFSATPGDIATLTDPAYHPAEEVVVFEQLPSWVYGNAALADVKRIECRFQASPRAPLDQRAANQPGLDVALTATLYYKTEKDATYDGADSSSIDGSALPAKVVTAMTAIVAEAEKRLGEGVITPMASLEKSVTGEDGVYTLAYLGITGGPSRVLSWSEYDLYEEISQDEDIDIFDGSMWEFQKPPLCSVQHTLDISSIGGSRSYVKPVSLGKSPGQGKWKQVYLGDTAPAVHPAGDGATQFQVSYKRNYKFKRKGKAAPEGRFNEQGYYVPTSADI